MYCNSGSPEIYCSVIVADLGCGEPANTTTDFHRTSRGFLEITRETHDLLQSSSSAVPEFGRGSCPVQSCLRWKKVVWSHFKALHVCCMFLKGYPHRLCIGILLTPGIKENRRASQSNQSLLPSRPTYHLEHERLFYPSSSKTHTSAL